MNRRSIDRTLLFSLSIVFAINLSLPSCAVIAQNSYGVDNYWNREEVKFPDDEDYGKLDEDGSGGSGSGDSGVEPYVPISPTDSPIITGTDSPRPMYFRATINITSVPYEDNFSVRTSPEFVKLSKDVISAIEALYGSTPGQQYVTVLKFEPGSVLATIDLGSLGYYDEEELKSVVSRAVQRGFIGKYRISNKGFTFRPFGTSPEPIPSPLPGICRSDQFQCQTNGKCLEPSQRCDKNFDCADGSDEENCPTASSNSTNNNNNERTPSRLNCRGDDQILCSDGTCIDRIRNCDGVVDCSSGEDEKDCASEICRSDQILCDNARCIERFQKCDGKFDCIDQTDERDCPKPSTPEPTGCAADEFQCKSGDCINFEKRCNIIPDCPQGDDESMCPECPDNAFRCRLDGKCIFDSLVCNDVKDCVDGSDEINCRACTVDQFRCNDRSCISMQKKCDGFNDCSDGVDEKDCVKCKEDEFTCRTDRKCIDSDLRCDGNIDCIDASDESGCPSTKKTCASNQFTCTNGKCINAGKLCNGNYDCSDGSDEIGCVKTCSSNQHTCNDGNCIDAQQKCDGKNDCQDGSDELGCAKPTCSSSQFTCNNGSCIDASLKCNGKRDCQDGSDEADCGDSRCRPGDIYCDGRCIPLRAQCDGIQHCRNNEDEKNCGQPTTETTPPPFQCSSNEFKCANLKQCIPSSKVCNSRPDCLDYSDELNCGVVPTPSCPANSFKCSDDSCIQQEQLCDGRRDCSNGEDEQNCTCKDNQFRCGDGQCIDIRRRCDSRLDCSDGADEANCRRQCSSGQFRCSDGTCIDGDKRCDRNYDCPDFSDERSCPTSKCRSDQFTCSNGQCVSGGARCNRRQECSDGSDESQCATSRCRSDQFTCSNGQCVSGDARCNRRQECSDGSDESQCETIECRVSEFRCNSGLCIDRARFCDGAVDCPDGSDENDFNCRRPVGDYIVKIYPERQRIKQTREVIFRCRDEGNRRARVQWARANNEALPAGSTDVNGRLTIPNVQPEHAGVYVCSVVGAPQGASGSSRIANLVVESYAPPTPKPPGVCTRNEATCQNGQCIPREYVCDNDYDCTDRSDEFNCGNVQKCEPNEFQCDNGNCIGKYWTCDGENDCGDNSDERNCESNKPGSACRYFEFQCRTGDQCIPRSFQCDGDIDCQDGTDEIGCTGPTVVEPPVETKVVTVGETVIIICRAIGTPTPIISWRLNWGHIPDTPRIISESKDGRGVLTIRDVQDNDQGAYTCEAINVKDRVIAQPDCILVVKTTPGICTLPYFNSNARSPAECLLCNCFGVSQSCQSSNLKMAPKILGRGVNIIGMVLTPSGLIQPIPGMEVSPTLNPLSRTYTIDSTSTPSADSLYYWSLPSSFHGNQLKSYGGYIRYTVRYRPSSPPQPLQIPDIIIVGKNITLYHFSKTKINPQTDNRIEAWIFEGQWQKSPIPERSLVGPTSRQDIMLTLQDVTSIYIRSSYDKQLVESSLTDFSLDSAESGGDDDSTRAIYVEQCQCPEGYEGLSCERCASGYRRQESGRGLGSCVRKPTCQCHQHSDICDPATGECYNCRHNTEGRRCESCSRGYYGDARQGNPEDCKPCPCPLTIPPNQFSPSCFLDVDNDVTCDACPPGYEGRKCERCAPNYAGNPLVVNDYCKPNTSRCDPVGSASPNPNPRTGRCYCKPHVTGPRCDQCAPNTFYLNKYAPNGCLDCFCSGITRACSSSTLNRNQVFTRFYDDRHGFTLSDLRRTYQIDRGLQVDQTTNELRFSGFSNQPRQVYYWQLPTTFLGNKLTSYGGFLNFTLSFSAAFNPQTNSEPDIQIVGNDIVLVYRIKDQPISDIPNRVSVPLYETLWQRSDGGDANREHMLMALAKLDAILIKASYGEDSRSSSIRDISLDNAEEINTGQDRAYAVEQCQCPPGYNGLSCETCASGYKRSGGGLYLGLCEACSCNGHSTDCHPNTGVCRNCQHNTIGEYCEQCAPGYTGDATRGSASDCRPGAEAQCRCDPSGSTGATCDFRNQCPCKSSVTGQNCDRCKENHFWLRAENKDGCSPCFCFGVSQQCSSGTFYANEISMDFQGSPRHEFGLSDRYSSEVINNGISIDGNRNEIYFRGFDQLTSKSPLYWLFPPKFLGKQLNSYGGKLSYTLRYTVRGEGSIFSDADIQISGNGKRLLHVNSEQPAVNDDNAISVDLTEREWQIVDSDSPRPATREDFMMVLANIESLMVRASYHTNMEASYLSNVKMTTAEPTPTGSAIVKSVEQCRCPEGYNGFSCEDCAPGYSRDRSSGSYLGRCIRCNCNGHAESCDPLSGKCLGCRHNTVGDRCDKCASGFYGDARRGRADDCKLCPCPLPIPSNSFSRSCYLGGDNRAVCDACQPGYTGKNCERCAEGYTGNPSQPGSRCVKPGKSRRIQVVIDEPKVKTASIGGTIVFRCSGRTQANDVQYTLSWFKENGELSSRATDINGELTIRNIQLQDAGTYICSGSDLVAIAQQQAVLIVQGTRIPTPPRVRIEPNFLRLKEGEPAEFRCIADGFPEPELTWTGGRNNVLNPSATFENGVFRIPSVRKSDEAQYFCSATNSLGTNRLNTLIYVTADQTSSRPTISVSRPVYDARPGETVRLTCQADGNPSPVISWSREGGQPLPSDATVIGGTINIVNVDQRHAGLYICTARNAIGSTSYKINLNIVTTSGRQPPTARINLERLVIGKNGDGELKCLVTGTPKPRITWSKIGGDLSPRITVDDDALIIKGALESDQGTYLCLVENDNGRAQSSTYLYIQRRDPPSVEIYPQAELQIFRDGSALFQCRVTGGIPNPTLKWTRADQRSLTDRTELLRGGVIKFNRVTEDEQGTYICTAENTAGRVKAEAVLKLNGSPSVSIQPQGPIIINEGEIFRVLCTANGDSIPNVAWKRQIRTRDNPLGVKELTLKEGRGVATLEIVKVTRVDAGLYICSASNELGVSQKSIELRVNDRSVVPGVQLQNRLVTVSFGSRAELRCSAIGGEKENIELRWIRSDGRRMSSNVRIQGGLLLIDSADSEHAGEYTCIGSLNGRELFRQDARIALIAPPRITLNPIRQTVKPGDNVRIQCSASGDEPITVDWKRVSGPLARHASDRNGLLEFRGIQVDDAGRYICTAVNAAGRAEAPAEVVVNDAPAGQLSKSENVFVGSNIELKCDINGANVQNVQWYKDNGRLPANAQVIDGKLWIRSVTEENQGRYMCQANTPNGVGRDFTVLNVRAVPTLMVKIKPSKKMVHMGNDLDLRCVVEGDPNAKVTWTKLESNSSFPENVNVFGKVLSIRNIKGQNGGIYRCSIDSFAGVFNDDYVLAIQVTPTIPSGEVETRQAPFGSTVVMDCQKKLAGRAAYTWSKQGGSLPPQHKVSNSEVTISNVRAEDAGIYICTIKTDDMTVDVPTILVVTGVVPYFAQAPTSYLSLPTLPAYVEFDIEVSFKPDKSDGLILFNGQKGGGGDYIAFGLNNGYAEFRFELGSGPAVVRSANPLELRKWHTVRMSRNGKEGRLKVDNEPEITAIAQGRFKGLDLQEPLYVGGMPNINRVGKTSGFSQGFVGCIGRLMIGGVEHDLINDAENTIGVTSCETCSNSPCLHGGVCQESLSMKGFDCICAAGFSGDNCEKVGEACYPGVCGEGRCINKPGGFDCYCPFGKTGKRCEKEVIILEPAFGDDSYAAYTAPRDAIRRLDMKMKFKLKEVKDGILMYCAQNENGQGDFVSMAIKDECLEFRFDTGSGPAILRSQRKLVPDEWIDVRAERNLQEGSLIMNDDVAVKGRSPGSTRGLNLLTSMYIGGFDDSRVTVSPYVEVKNGFNGCISKVEINNVNIDLVSSVVDASNIDECSGQTGCESKPCKNDGACVQLAGGTVDYTCICGQGFEGRHCEVEQNVCDNIQPCLNGGSCVSKGNTYKCNCHLGYSGRNCDNEAKFDTRAQLQGDSYLEFDSQLLPHTSTVKETIKVSFETSSEHGVLFFHGQKPETEGRGRDYLVLALVDGFLVFSYELGSGGAEIRSSVKVNDGLPHTVILERTGRDGSMLLDDFDKVVGSSQGSLEMLNTEGHIYIGGVPDHEKMTADQFPKGWTGCIYNLEIQNSGVIDLNMKARRGANVQSCDSQSQNRPSRQTG